MPHAATSTTTQRRTIRFVGVDDALAEVGRVAAAAREGRLRTLGAWSAAEMFDHLSRLIEMGYGDIVVKSPRILRVIGGPLFKRRFLSGRIMAGMPLKGGAAVLLPAPDATLDAAEARLRRALGRMRAGEPMTAVSPLLGRMTPEEWTTLQLRHMEHHLSFLIVR